MKLQPRPILTALTFLCVIAVGPRTQANPPLTPDPGPKPVSNTADGQNALVSITTGIHNTAVGFDSLLSNTAANFNTAVGSVTLLLNNGTENTAVGAGALLSNVTGTGNTANGAFTLFNNTASGNTAVGARALLNNTTGGTIENIQGVDIGPNVAVGWQALESNTVASANTAVGYQALHSFTTGPVDFEQLGLCTAVGFQALANATGAGILNSAFGFQALVNNTDGGGNTAVGLGTLFSNTTGSANVAIGNNALNNSNGDQNVALGFNAGAGVTTGSNVICIGNSVFGDDVNDSCYIGNIFNQTSASGTQVFVNSNNKLGTMTSSKRFKEDIKPTDEASEVLFALKPVTFRYKKEIDPAATSQCGLVAEDVEKVNPDLVVHDKEGKPYSVRYDQVNAMLLNEFLKEHKAFIEAQCKMQEQEVTIVQLTKQMETVVARLKVHDSEIQKVSAQVQVNESVTKVAESSR